MARIRSIKPEFFKHEELFDAEMETGFPLRVAFSGLWTVCDREGRFEWRPRKLKTDVMPYDDIDFSRVLDALATRGFIVKYTVDGDEYGYVPSWNRHQIINNREAKSSIPQPPENIEASDASSTREARVNEIAKGSMEGEGKGKGYSEANASGADAPIDFEKLAFERGKQVLGKNAGGVINRLKNLKCKTWPATVAMIEEAATKQSPMEWVQGVLRKQAEEDDPMRGVDCSPLTPEQRAYALANGLS